MLEFLKLSNDKVKCIYKNNTVFMDSVELFDRFCRLFNQMSYDPTDCTISRGILSSKFYSDINSNPILILNFSHNCKITLNSKKINAGLALNKNSSEDLLHSIALSSNTYFKKYVAENESTAPETLDYLAKEINSTLIKIEVAKNSSTSIETLFYLANLKDPELYYPIKTNINLTEELFQLINKLEYQ